MNFSIVDFTKCAEFATSNLAKIASELWNDGNNVKQISEKLKLHKHTIISYLKQGNENRITAISEERAIALTLNNTYRPKSGESMKLLFDMIDRVVENADIFEMSCRNEPAAAQMSYKAMKG